MTTAKTEQADAPVATKAAAQPKVKDKRSKAQIKMDADADVAKALLDLWLKYKGLIALAFSNRPLSDGAEQQFLEVTGGLQRQQRAVLKVFPRDINFGNKVMTALMRDSVSLQHMRDLPEYDKKRLYNSWHSVYVELTRAVGAMRFIAEGYVHKPATKEEVDIRRLKQRGAQEQTPPYKNPTVITLSVVSIIVLVFLLAYTEMIHIPFLFGP